jgi:glc operon protein GlcG
MTTAQDTLLFDVLRARAVEVVLRAHGRGEALSLVLVDRSGEVVSVVGADPATARRTATRRARAAASLGMSTADVSARVRGASMLRGGSASDVGPGGVPVYLEGRLVGAFGVAGDDLAQDTMLAEEARAVSVRPLAAPLPRAA